MFWNVQRQSSNVEKSSSFLKKYIHKFKIDYFQQKYRIFRKKSNLSFHKQMEIYSEMKDIGVILWINIHI